MTLQSLLENAEARAVPDQHLARVAPLVDEEVQVAVEWIASETLFHEAVQSVVALAQIRSLGVRVNAY